jgi:hypothetical protein
MAKKDKSSYKKAHDELVKKTQYYLGQGDVAGYGKVHIGNIKNDICEKNIFDLLFEKGELKLPTAEGSHITVFRPTSVATYDRFISTAGTLRLVKLLRLLKILRSFLYPVG